MEFRDDTSEGDATIRYRYDGRLPRTPFHGLVIHYYEGGAYLLVNDSTGGSQLVAARPVVSPNGQWLATASFDLEAQYDPNAVAILRRADDTLEVAWLLEPTTWGPDSIDWRGSDSLHIVQGWVTDMGGFDRRDAVVVRDAGNWQITPVSR